MIAKNKKKVLLRGPLLSQSGYGTHARQLVSWLLSRQDLTVAFDVTPWGSTSWYINKDAQNGLIGKIIDNCSKPEVFKPDVSIQLQLPDEWNAKLAPVNIGITAGVETDRCNPEWTSKCNAMSLVITPSEFAKASLGKVNNLKVVPEAYPDFQKTKTSLDSDLNNIQASELYLVFGQLTATSPESDRKNTFNTLTWLYSAIKNRDAKIILKTNFSRNTSIDKHVTLDALQRLLPKEVLSRVVLLHGDLSDNEVYSLYTHKKMKALVTLTRGEGFCLPALEATACELPVIATDATGHVEFLLNGFLPIKCSKVNIPKERVDNRIFMRGSSWYEPDRVDFMMKMNTFFNETTAIKKLVSNRAKEIKVEYSIEKIIEQYNTATSDLI
jgi:glycosyltransferase involved in cell wall biosynthesis